MTAINAPERKHGIGSWSSPVHAGTLHPLLDHVTDGTFNGSAADVIAELLKGFVHHAVTVLIQIADEIIDFSAFGP